jgi:hypothetical protein
MKSLTLISYQTINNVYRTVSNVYVTMHIIMSIVNTTNIIVGIIIELVVMVEPLTNIRTTAYMTKILSIPYVSMQVI